MRTVQCEPLFYKLQAVCTRIPLRRLVQTSKSEGGPSLLSLDFFFHFVFFCVIIANVATVSHLTTASCWMQKERHILIDCFLDGKKKEAGRLNKRCVSQPLALKRGRALLKASAVSWCGRLRGRSTKSKR